MSRSRLAAVVLLAVVTTLLTPPPATAVPRRPHLALDALPPLVGVGGTVELQGAAYGPGPRPVLAQRLQDGRWVTVERDVTRGWIYFSPRAPRRVGTYTWRVVAPQVRVHGRVLPRLVSRTRSQRVVRQQVRWSFPRTARVGSEVTAAVRFVPYIRYQLATLQQEVNGHWQYVGDAVPLARRPAEIGFVQVTTGPSRFRVRGPDGRYVVRTLRGTPTTTVGQTRRVSVTANGSQLDEGSYDAVASDDGRYVAFTSYANNAVLGDRNRRDDVYLKDTVTGAVRRVSHATGAGEPGGESGDAAISGDGSVVAFTSKAANLVRGDKNKRSDLFLWRRSTGQITRVENSASDPSLSADGRYLAYTFRNPDVVPLVSVADLEAGISVQVSEGAGPATASSISADGGRVVFQQDGQIHLWERSTATTSTVTAGAAPHLSGDGTVLAYQVSAGGHSQVFRTDLAGGTSTTPTLLTRRDGVPGDADSHLDAISADGSVVVITSDATLTADDVDRDSCESEAECYTDLNLSDVFVAGADDTISLVSRSSTGAVSGFQAEGGDVLADGSAVLFDSRDSLVPGQSTRDEYSSVHAYLDVFVRDLGQSVNGM